MKELKFTPENLQRHLRAQPRKITTTRDSYKGGVGTVFQIEGVGYFRVACVQHYFASNRWAVAQEYWKEEGFANTQAFFAELGRLYPDSEDFFVYHLEEVYLD